MGGLDVVAPVITMFFLNTYGIVNLIATMENVSGNPSYRPKLKVHWVISLIGAIGCYLTMFAIHATATIAAILISLGIFVLLSHKELRTNWGDVRYGLWYSLARFIIFKLEDSRRHPRDWRPNVMVFSGNPNTRKQLVEFANLLGGKKGIVTMYQLILGDWDKVIQHRKPATNLLKNFIRENDLHALGQVHIASNFRDGIRQIVQAHGLGQFRSNLVLLGWCQELSREMEFATLLRELNQLEKSILVLNIPEGITFGQQRQFIDIWWGGIQNNGSLMILIAHLISVNPEWQGCRIRLNMIIDNQEGLSAAKTNLEDILQKAHLNAEVNIILQESPNIKIPYIINKQSQNSGLVILGMNTPLPGEEKQFIERMHFFLAGLPPTLLVKNVEEILVIF